MSATAIGGAPCTSVQQWFQKTVTALRQSNWNEAAFNAGVLSHYYTDPIQPFHTGQSEAESNIHRAAEWSICKAYDDLRGASNARPTSPTFPREPIYVGWSKWSSSEPAKPINTTRR